MSTAKNLIGNYILLTLVSPVLSVLYLVRNAGIRMLVPAGTILMVVLGSIYVYLPGSDGDSHRNTVESGYLDMGFLDFFTGFMNLLILNNENVPSGIDDPYLHVLSFLSGSIFGLPELIHVFAAIVYGFIYFNILKILFQRITLPRGVSLIVILLAIFFTYRGITGFNSIRWWTGFWLMFLGFLSYWHYGKSKYLFLSFLAVYVHYSFVAFLFPIVGSLWLFRRPKLVMAIWILSFFLGASYTLIKPYIPSFEVIQNKEQYTLDEEKIERTTAARSSTPVKSKRLYAELGEITFRDYSIPLLIIVLFGVLKQLSGPNRMLIYQLFSAGVLLYSFGNFMEFSPAINGRARSGAAPIIMLCAIISFSTMYENNSKLYQSFAIRIVMTLFFVSAIPVILFHLSYAINMLSAFVLIFPIASWLLGPEDLSLRELIAYLLF